MTRLTQEIFAIIVPKAAYGPPAENGARKWSGFRVDRITQNRPTTKNSEVAVRLKLTVDSSIFDKLIPFVEVELGERELFVNTKVEINGEAIEDDEPVQDGEGR